MQYRFPEIKRIEDVLPAIAGRDEFVVAERPWGTVIDYQVATADTFPALDSNDVSESVAALRRECRGIKFDTSGVIIARPYQKFFNLGEKAETMDETLSANGRFHENFTIMPKLDGSMIHPILWDNQIHFCTRMGTTDVAQQAMNFISVPVMSYFKKFCCAMIQRGMTPIFEWCSRKQRIVIDYPEDQLLLTAVRHMVTGEYMTRGKMLALSVPFGIPVVDLYNGDWKGIEEFGKHVRNLENAEGYVLRWDDGHMVKMKGEWYVAIHRAKDSIAHEKRIIGMLLNDDIDDVLPHLLPSDFERITKYREDFWKKISKTASDLESVVSIARSFTDATGMEDHEAKGIFAKNTVAGYTGQYAPLKRLLFQIWDGENGQQVIIDFLRKKFSLDVPGAKSNGSEAVVAELRAAFLLPEKDWLDY